MKSITAVLMFLAVLGGCNNGTLGQSTDAQSGEASPARIPTLSETGRAELATVISTSLGGTPVLVGREAFKENHVLLIERTPQRDPQGNRLPGRVYEKPERFELLLHNGRCILLRSQTDERWELNEIDCVRI